MTQREVVGFSLPAVSSPVRTATAPWCLLVGRMLALWTALLCGLLVAAQFAKADDFIFHDTTEGLITVTTNGDPLRVQPGGVCAITAGAEVPFCWTIFPPNFNVFDRTTPSVVNAGLSERNATAASDEASILNIPSAANAFVTLQVASEIEGVSATPPFPNCLPATGGIPCFTETGSPVQVLSFTWQSGVTDTISIESDVVEVVPEPASLILLGSGLTFAGAFLRRRRRPGDILGLARKGL